MVKRKLSFIFHFGRISNSHTVMVEQINLDGKIWTITISVEK